MAETAIRSVEPTKSQAVSSSVHTSSRACGSGRAQVSPFSVSRAPRGTPEVNLVPTSRLTPAEGCFSEGSARARAAWEVLYDAHPEGYVYVDAEDGGPTYLGEDKEERPQWSFAVEAHYTSR